MNPRKAVNGFLLGVMMLTILTACSTKPSLELTDVDVDISRNQDLTGSIVLQEGEEAGKEVAVTALTYIFTLENTGKRQVGKESEMIDATIVPNDSLRTASQNVMGFNVFEPSGYDESGLGFGHSFSGKLEPKDNGTYVFTYDLGIEEKTTDVRRVPPNHQLNKLKQHALDATLVVSVGKQEIARFGLTSWSKETNQNK